MRLIEGGAFIHQQTMKNIQRQLCLMGFELTAAVRGFHRALHSDQRIAQAPLDQVKDAFVDAKGVAQKADVDPRITLQRRRQQTAGFIVAAVGDQIHRHRAGQHHVQVHFIGGHAGEQCQAQAATFLGLVDGAQLQAVQYLTDVGVLGTVDLLQALGDLQGVLHSRGSGQ
ncbi:hypothetical protein D3C84_726960 [compost metagenome]